MGVAYVIILVCGILGSRTALVGARGGVQRRNVALAFLGMAATFISLSLIVWGFAALPWYWPVGTFLAASTLSGMIITRTNWGTWFFVAPILDIVAATGGLFLWIKHSPF